MRKALLVIMLALIPSFSRAGNDDVRIDKFIGFDFGISLSQFTNSEQVCRLDEASKTKLTADYFGLTFLRKLSYLGLKPSLRTCRLAKPFGKLDAITGVFLYDRLAVIFLTGYFDESAEAKKAFCEASRLLQRECNMTFEDSQTEDKETKDFYAFSNQNASAHLRMQKLRNGKFFVEVKLTNLIEKNNADEKRKQELDAKAELNP